MSDENLNENYFESSIVGDIAIVSEVPPDDVVMSLPNIGGLDPRIYRAVASWAEDTHSRGRYNRGLFQRDKFVTPSKVYAQMGMAYDALDDDIIGNVADTSEAIALQKMKWEVADQDQADVWSQIGRDLNLDEFLRIAWRELFTVSQFYGIKWMGRKTYKVRGKRDKRAARKEFDIVVPTGLGFLDPTRVVPVAQDMFGRHSLAWIASDSELAMLMRDSRDGLQSDEVVDQLFLGPYEPTKTEARHFGNEDIPVERLVLLNPENVWSHSLTKSPFERWSRIRMKSVFPLLDLKHQLREMDRAFLLGGINFLVLVTRGTDDRPTNTTEVSETAAQVRAQSRSPIIVTDHRISIEIITPDVEHVLSREKWQVIDDRMMMRLWGTFQLPNSTGNQETSLTLGRLIARGLTSRRHMLKRSIEAQVVKPVIENPFNIQAGFTEDAKIEFSPRRMELEFDAAITTMLQELRDRGDISRETVLAEFDFDQDMEAKRREYEDERYDDIFTPVNVPFDSPNRTTPGGAGRQGGRPAGQGGGSSSGGSSSSSSSR